MSPRLADLARAGAARLAQAGIADSAREARLLLAGAAGMSPGRLILCLEDYTESPISDRFETYLARRVVREPVSHILGERAFYDHQFLVTADVLDPRPETETLVQAALDLSFGTVLDLGTGSGAILLSLLAARPDATGLGTDICPRALDVARQNATRLGLENVCRFCVSDWYEAVTDRFDLVVSNPPYIAADEMAGLAPELQHEPRGALTDESDGLSAYRVITARSADHLRPGGTLMVEIGWQQGAAVAAMFAAAGYEGRRVLQDLDGRDRVILGRKPA